LEIFLGPDPAPGQPVEHQQDWISRTGVKKKQEQKLGPVRVFIFREHKK